MICAKVTFYLEMRLKVALHSRVKKIIFFDLVKSKKTRQ